MFLATILFIPQSVQLIMESGQESDHSDQEADQPAPQTVCEAC